MTSSALASCLTGELLDLLNFAQKGVLNLLTLAAYLAVMLWISWPLTAFVLPGGAPAAAALHVARATCRRAERRSVALSHLAPIDPAVVVYLNRLSDFLFEAARAQNQRTGVAETLWQPRKGT